MTAAPVADNPYVGPRSFQTGEKLYGRDLERRDLLDLLIARRIVLLYSPSGAGKSSLINAGLIPPLREEEGFRVLPTVRVNLDPWAALGISRADPLPARDGRPFNRYIFSLLLSFEENLPPEQRTPPADLACQGLEAYLTCCPNPDNPREDLVLIFDQFEEIITTDPTDREGKLAFFAEVGEVLANRRRWALFAMREDYMPALEPYLRLLPTRLATTFRLDLLGREAARQAIQNPAADRGVSFAREAADRLIDDLSTVQVQQPDGSWLKQPGLYVEPVQLQVVCYRLWERLVAGRPGGPAEISLADLDAQGSLGQSLVDQSLAGYYTDRVAEVAEKSGASQRAIREWVEHELISEGGVRGLVLMGAGSSKGLSNAAIQGLVNAHLVRAEKRAGATWFELAHDRLVEPVRADNARWREANLTPLQRQAALWKGEGEPDRLLLRSQALVEARAWAAAHAGELTADERRFLDQSVAEDEREQAEQRAQLEEAQRRAEEQQRLAEAQKQRAEEQARSAGQLRRLTRIIAVALVLALITTVAAGIFWQQANVASRASAALAATNALVADQNRAFAATNEVIAATARAAQSTSDANAQLADENARLASEARITAEAASLLEENRQATASAAAEAVVQQATAIATYQTAVAPVSGNSQTSEDLSLSLASLSTSFLDSDPDLALLLSVEAVQASQTDPANAALARSLVKGQRLWGYKSIFTSLALSPSGKWVAWVGPSGSLELWDLPGQQYIWSTYGMAKQRITALAFDPAGQRLAAGTSNAEITVWDVQSGKQLISLQTISQVNALAFSPAGDFLAAAVGTHVYLWNPADLGNPQDLGAPGRGEITHLAWSPNGQYLVAGGPGAGLGYWLLSRGARFTPLALQPNQVNFLAWGPDSDRLAAGGDDEDPARRLIVFDMQSEAVTLGQDSAALAGAISPDGRVLAVSGADGSLVFWAEGQSAPLSFSEQPEVIVALAFSADGQALYTVDESGTTLLWDFTSLAPSGDLGAAVELACRRAGRNFTGAEWEQFFPGQPWRPTCPQYNTGSQISAAAQNATLTATPTQTPAAAPSPTAGSLLTPAAGSNPTPTLGPNDPPYPTETPAGG